MRQVPDDVDTIVDGPNAGPSPQAPRPATPVHGLPGVPVVAGYEVLAVLGEGGMAVVYEAKHVALKRNVALKMLRHPALAATDELVRFRLEAELLASLKHPNIVQVYEIGDAGGRPYFALELVAGGSLAKAAKTVSLTPRRVAEILVVVARAVHSAHQHGVIHRDLKPANILLTDEGVPKVADFGIARRSASSPEDSGDLFGTPGYMAPEMIDLPWAVTHSADIFGLGATLYALLVGRPPYKAATVDEILRMTGSEAPVPPSKVKPNIPRDLEVICLKCLARTPAERYATAAALADDLERWLAGEPILARRMGRLERVVRWCRGNPIPLALFAATVLGSVASIVYMSRLSIELAQMTALSGAAQEIETLEKVTDYYNERVVARVDPLHVKTSTRYAELSGAIPNPATLTIELGDVVTSGSEVGQQVRMYSDLPFANRAGGGPRNEFEKRALVMLRKDPTAPYYSFETSEGRMVLRYAKARVLKKACVDCHNAHAESPKTDWKEGDVRGALEVVRYLDADVRKSRSGLRGTAVLVGSACAILFGMSGVAAAIDVVRKRRASRP